MKWKAGDVVEWGSPPDVCAGTICVLFPHALLVDNHRDNEKALVARSRARRPRRLPLGESSA